MLKMLNLLRFILIAVWTVICAVLSFLLIIIFFRKEMASFVGRAIWSPVILYICGVRLVITGKENISSGEKNIYISNHGSLLDIPAVFTAIPVNLFFIAKKELKKVPFMGWAMLMGGMIFIDRRNKEQAKKDMHRAGELIKKGKNIISFPEGTRTTTGEIGTFKRGTFLLSVNTGINIVPIAIKGARELLPSESFFLKPGKIYLHIFPPCSPENYSLETVEVFAQGLRTKISDKISQW